LNHVPRVDLNAAAPKAFTLGSALGGLWAKPQRSHPITLSALAGVIFIAFLSLVLSGRAAILVLDKPSQHFVYPFTIRNLMHIVFFVGLGDLFVRWRIAIPEKNFLRLRYLPEDDQTVLVTQDLGPIRKRAGRFAEQAKVVPRSARVAHRGTRWRWPPAERFGLLSTMPINITTGII
jgi:hypothetical protein